MRWVWTSGAASRGRAGDGQELLAADYAFGRAASDPTVDTARARKALDQAEQTLRAEGTDDLRIRGFEDALADYADGHRSILEIRDSIAAEFVPMPIEAVELYFRIFEKSRSDGREGKVIFALKTSKFWS